MRDLIPASAPTAATDRSLVHERSLVHGELVLSGPAQLVMAGGPVKLRKKGLALLYVLALEGATRRERLADLLWDKADAASNLRVELHRLRERLAPLGLSSFGYGDDPLTLPAWIAVDRASAVAASDALQGLDDISPRFQKWLEAQRGLLSLDDEYTYSNLRPDLVDETARTLIQPGVLVLKGPPGSGRQQFAAAFAKRLGLPLTQDPMGPALAVHVVDTSTLDPEAMADHILRQKVGVWILMESTFDPDSELLLWLRHRFTPDRMRFIELGPLPWHDARKAILNGLSFEEAARLYVLAGGHVGFMTELMQLRPPDGFSTDPPLPQRIRAGYLLEAQRLPDPARAVLDQISVHPGPLPDPLLSQFGFADHVYTLESGGWLHFHREWTFRDETARRIIYSSLQAGRRMHYHARFAEAFAAAPGRDIAATYHRALAGQEPMPDPARVVHNAWSTPPAARFSNSPSGVAATRGVSVGSEFALLLDQSKQLDSAEDDRGWYWVRRPHSSEPGFAVFALPEEPCVVRLSARWYDETVLGVGVRGEAFPLRASFRGGSRPERQAFFVSTTSPTKLTDGTLILPNQRETAVAFVCDHRSLTIETRIETGVVEFEVQGFEVAGPYGGPVQAYDLSAT